MPPPLPPDDEPPYVDPGALPPEEPPPELPRRAPGDDPTIMSEAEFFAHFGDTDEDELEAK